MTEPQLPIAPRRTLQEVYEVILERQRSGAESSYVASLLRKGPDAILKKIGEEAAEVIIAAKTPGAKANCIHELADLWFHSLVLMVAQGLTLEDIEYELGRRFGQSGLAEKASRAPS